MFFRSTFATTQGSISTKCASAPPLERLSIPIAPVPANKSSHRVSSFGKLTLDRLPMTLMIMSKVAPRTIPIIGRVSRPDGESNFRLANDPATIVNRLCVRFTSSFRFTTLNSSTTFFSRSNCRKSFSGTPIFSIRAVSSSFFLSAAICLGVSSSRSPFSPRPGFMPSDESFLVSSSTSRRRRGRLLLFFFEYPSSPNPPPNCSASVSTNPLANPKSESDSSSSSSSMLNRSTALSLIITLMAPSGTKNQSFSSSSSSTSSKSSIPFTSTSSSKSAGSK
mmetsp:Transcript_6797/g.25682  ORF Transcript_6797/g.25682 Transcript_6797/m.25682 type:complete len:279 (+) Transcript_6797:804-1640(+)